MTALRKQPAMIVVTGATGKLGSLILHALLDLTAPDRIGASARDPAKASELAARGVRVRQGDFAEPESLTRAFEGASQILMVSSNAAASGGDPIAQHRNAIAAAKAAGVRRIVYTSHMGASAASAFAPMHTHAETEAMLADSGIAWTALRNGFYAATVPQLIGDAAKTGVIALPVDGPVSWTAHADLAQAAARILLDEGKFDGPTPPLTATDAHDMADVAAILTAQLGRPIERKMVTDEDEQAGLAARGLPAGAIANILGIYRAARAGEFAATDPTLAEILGASPQTLDDVLAHAAR